MSFLSLDFVFCFQVQVSAVYCGWFTSECNFSCHPLPDGPLQGFLLLVRVCVVAGWSSRCSRCNTTMERGLLREYPKLERVATV